MSTESPPPLSRRVAAGAAWLAGVRMLVRSIGLLSTIILARLLLPEDFGLVALASALMFVLETLSDLRFEQAIIAQRDTSNADFDTAFTLNVLRSVGVALLIALLAFPYAALMSDTRLAGLLLVLAVAPLINGLKNPAFVTYEKSLSFQREFVLQLSHKVTTFAVTVSLALIWRNYWALVAGMLVGSVVRVAGSYLLHPYRPHLALSAWRRLVGFSGWLMASNLVAAVLQRMEIFLIGAFLPTPVVGRYHVGAEIANLASNELTLPLKRALLPALSSLDAGSSHQYASFRRAIEVNTAIVLPVGIGLSLVAEPFVRLVLGDRWLETSAIITFLAPAAAVRAVAGMCDVLSIASGNTRLVFRRELTKAVVAVPLFAVGIWADGLRGLLYAVAAIAVFVLAINLDMVRRQSGRPLLEPLRGAWRSVVACVAMVGALNLLPAVPPRETAMALLFEALAPQVLTGAAVYAAAHLLLWLSSGRPPGPEQYLLGLLGERRRPGTQ
ncbi:MAG: lipopolysaccharide biosynthesis protein [Chromatiaceae bacterium]|nr:lipopolysaccharide biosynthesis protein [Chromatiaceae bacterium]